MSCQFFCIIGGGKFSEEVSAYSRMPVLNYNIESIDYIPAVLAVGSPKYKKEISDTKSFMWVNYIDLKATCHSLLINKGIIVLPGTIITTNCKIGNHVSINLNCTIGHDTEIGDYTTIHPGCNISGNVKIGSGCEIGTNSCIIPGVVIGNNVVIGAGSVVIRNVPDNTTVVGNPAKVLPKK